MNQMLNEVGVPLFSKTQSIYFEEVGLHFVPLILENENRIGGFIEFRHLYANGSHPVSGNRQFGIKQLSNGSYEFYIRAADRARINWVVSSMSWLTGNNSTEIFYEITDQAWNNLMTNVVSLINDPDNGGVASQNAPIIMRPDWDEVKNKLKSNEIMTIPCKY